MSLSKAGMVREMCSGMLNAVTALTALTNDGQR